MLKALKRTRAAQFGCALLISGLGSASVAQAATPGTLDAGFGSHGLAAASGARLLGSAVQRDGKLVAAGESGSGTSPNVVLARFTTSGALDSSFGSGGIVHGPAVAGAPGTLARAVAVQADGKLVVVGKVTDASEYARNGLLVERFNANGSLDTSFGSNGVVDVMPGAYGDGYSVAVQSDGKIVATGSVDAAGSGGTTPRVAVVRLNSNGSLDTTFRGGGVDVIDLGAYSYALAVALQGSNIVIAGSQAPGLQVPNALVAQLSSSGALNWAQAKQYAVGAASSVFNAVAIQPNGAIVAGGAAAAGQKGANALLARFTSSGQPDGSFGSGGVAVSTSAVNFNQTGNQPVPGIQSLAVASNGDIVGAGTFISGVSSVGAVWAFKSNGAVDTSFGSRGATVLTAGGNSAEFAGLAISPVTGQVLAAGDSWQPFTENYTGLVAGYVGFSTPTPPALKLSVKGISRSYKSSTVAKHGLKLTAACNEACTLGVSLIASASTAKQLHIKTTVRKCTRSHGRTRCRRVRGYFQFTVASGKTTLRGAGSKTFVLRLSRSFSKALAKQRSVRLTLSVTATSPATHKGTGSKTTVTFKR